MLNSEGKSHGFGHKHLNSIRKFQICFCTWWAQKTAWKFNVCFSNYLLWLLIINFRLSRLKMISHRSETKFRWKGSTCYTLLTWSTLFRLLTLVMLFKLLYTASLVTCLPVLLGKVRTLLEWADARLSKKWEWMDGVEWIHLRLLWLLEHLWC